MIKKAIFVVLFIWLLGHRLFLPITPMWVDVLAGITMLLIFLSLLSEGKAKEENSELSSRKHKDDGESSKRRAQ